MQEFLELVSRISTIIFIVTFAMGVTLYESYYDFADNDDFDREEWIESRIKPGSDLVGRASRMPRRYMMRDLSRNYLSRGMTSEKVIELLGPPDSILMTLNVLDVPELMRGDEERDVREEYKARYDVTDVVFMKYDPDFYQKFYYLTGFWFAQFCSLTLYIDREEELLSYRYGCK